ncbi:DUF3179 domain-containing (seleno)protein [Haloarculaceae archaeon H-GB11]|nr:DUF3179 domain-containing (seleno)protein [Haloarculaceae archaeon H-GB11]
MDRRQYLMGAAAGLTGGLAGCLGRAAPRADGGRRESPLVQHGLPPTVCGEDVHEDPGIYAITDPVFGPDWDGLDVEALYLPYNGEFPVEEMTVVSVEHDGVARAYPLTILWHHEIVNDTIAGLPLIVTYCPLCRSGVVAERRVNGEPTTFAVSGLLWKAPAVYEGAAAAQNKTFGAVATGGERTQVTNNGNLVLYDYATRSYWSQILAQGICGPNADTDLTIVPSSVARYDEWLAAHPDGEVLLPPPHSKTVQDVERATE